jgi:alanyl-tRNA synthetase
MRNMTSDEIRDTWLNFFKDHGHYIEPSASLVPNNDPTLLWINAGVAALKKYFDGTLTPKHRRITNAQKCIRTNDIDNVGHTARHHTFFEMLGNFSIGDYFRPEVIPWAYDLLTNPKNFGLDKDRLYITYYPDDMDTLNLWIKCGMDPKNMVPCKNNFWEIGEGPCGPDTEINYDRGEKWDPQGLGVKLVQDDLENDRYIELWNIVFSQFNSEPGKPRSEYKPLPQKNIDTGAGLERIACIMQGTDTNFETDLFMPYINEISKRSKVPYEGKNRLAYRVIADHIRSITFALADGAVFSNDGRGYVLKRLLRRASRYAQTIGLDAGSLSDLVPLVVTNMAHYYPYLSEHEDRTIKMIKNEEDKFASTLKNGEKLLANYLDKPGTVLSGEDAFRLADTYGFPYELTKEITEDAGKKVDEDSYTKLLNDSKELARKSRGDRQSFGLQSKDLIAFTPWSSRRCLRAAWTA